jgi:hypothetical protein
MVGRDTKTSEASHPAIQRSRTMAFYSMTSHARYPSPPLTLDSPEGPCTVDSPQIGHLPDPDKPVALRTCTVTGTEFGCMTARLSPPKSVILRNCPVYGCPI